MKKTGRKQDVTSQRSQRQTRSARGLEQGSSAAILPPRQFTGGAKKRDRQMEKAAAAAGPEIPPPASPGQETASDAITRPLLEATDASKAAVMVRIDHFAMECTLIRHDLDKKSGVDIPEQMTEFLKWRTHSQGVLFEL